MSETVQTNWREKGRRMAAPLKMAALRRVRRLLALVGTDGRWKLRRPPYKSIVLYSAVLYSDGELCKIAMFSRTSGSVRVLGTSSRHGRYPPLSLCHRRCAAELALVYGVPPRRAQRFHTGPARERRPSAKLSDHHN